MKTLQRKFVPPFESNYQGSIGLSLVAQNAVKSTGKWVNINLISQNSCYSFCPLLSIMLSSSKAILKELPHKLTNEDRTNKDMPHRCNNCNQTIGNLERTNTHKMTAFSLLKSITTKELISLLNSFNLLYKGYHFHIKLPKVAKYYRAWFPSSLEQCN